MFFVAGAIDNLVVGNTRRQRRINYLKMPIIRSSDPYFTRNYLISMDEAQEITFDIFEIFLNFCVFLVFFKISEKMKPPYWLRYSPFKVEDMAFTKGFKT